ncbi:MAG: TIGR04255 family protein [Planctomycetes bacterium]|nr:TIGR04255 family protein [Planctomycetota bacterium]
MRDLPNPLRGGPPAEVPLERAPLELVIAQVRFPLVAAISTLPFLAPFQEAIRTEYPILREEQIERRVGAGPNGRNEFATAWSFHATDSAWRVVLTSDFLALETRRYTSRSDFLARFERLIAALRQLLGSTTVQRLGVRYIDRITGAELQHIGELVRAELGGLIATPLGGQLLQSLGIHHLQLPEEGAQAMIRTGLVPAGQSLDPNAIEALPEPSWVLDIDAFQHYPDGSTPLDAGTLLPRTRSLCERIYALFRWSVTDQFLSRFGANA